MNLYTEQEMLSMGYKLISEYEFSAWFSFSEGINNKIKKKRTRKPKKLRLRSSKKSRIRATTNCLYEDTNLPVELINLILESTFINYKKRNITRDYNFLKRTI